MKKFTSIIFITVLANASLSAKNFSHSSGENTSIHFKENKGQISDQYYKPRPDILFSGNQGELVFHLKNNGISYQLNRIDEWSEKDNYLKRKNNSEQLIPTKSTLYRVDVNWLNSNLFPEIKKGNTIQGSENYYLESCPNGALGVQSYSDLTYKNLYPGIDLKWYEKNGLLEYDYYVAANTDYTKIQLEYKGAETIYLDADGALIIKTPLGIIKEQKPLVLQNNKPLEAYWQIKNNIVSFDIKNVNSSLPLIIDPTVRLWATYYGGLSDDDVYYTYANTMGEVFMSGSTRSAANIATTGAHQTTFAGAAGSGDAYIVKFDPSGVRLWATYYGGTGHDYACESITDANGNVFLTGGTQSSAAGVIATPGAHQTVYSTSATNIGDAFLVMFNSSGIRQWGTYYGGSNLDFGNGISLDNSGNIFITGASQSTTNISTAGSNQPALFSGQDCFLAKFNSAGVRQWGTYYGGNDVDVSTDCVTNANGETYITGATSSSVGIATLGSHQALLGGGPSPAADAILAKFNSAGVLQWGTYIGGTGSEFLNKLALDAAGDLYCAGWTSSGTASAIATPGSHQSIYGGGDDAFLVKFNAAGIRQWGTYYGGIGHDYGGAPAIDAAGNVYLSGDASTSTGTSIATPCAYQPQFAGGSADAFLAKFTNTGKRIWGTYYGSIYTEYSYCSFADGQGNIYLSGFTYANSGTVIASSNGHQPIYGGGNSDAFLVKLDGCNAGAATNLTPPSNLLVCPGNSATLSASCGNWYNSPTGNIILATGGTFTTGILTSDSTFYVEDFGCGTITGTRTAVSVSLATTPSITIISNNPNPCVGESVILTASGASTYSWSNNPITTATLQLFALLNTTFTVNGLDANGCKATATLAVNPNICTGIEENRGMNAGILIYPNPNNGIFNLQSALPLRLMLSNELGQIIRTISLTSSNGYSALVDNLPNGVYFLTGEKDTKSLNKKIIVIR